MATLTLKQMRTNWLNINQMVEGLELTTDEVCNATAETMIEKDWTFIDAQVKVFRGKDSDWKADKGQTKAIEEDNSKDAKAYKALVGNMGRRFEKVAVDKDDSGRDVFKLAVKDGKAVAKKAKDHSFSDGLLERAKKSHGLTLKMLKADDTCNNNLDLAVRLERLDNQKALQMNFEKIRPELVKIKHAGGSFGVDDVLDYIRIIFETTNLHIDVHGDIEPKTTRVTRLVQDVDDEAELDSTLNPEQMKMFKAMMKMVANA